MGVEMSGIGVETSVPVESSSSALMINGGGTGGSCEWLASGSTRGLLSMVSTV